MYRTEFNTGYIPPSSIRIQRASEDIGMDTRAVDAIQDMAALVAGAGRPISGEEMRERVKAEAARRPLKPTLDNKYMIRETGEVFDRPVDAYARQEQVLYDYHIGMRDFMVEAAKDPLVIGNTPMETALLTFKAMRDMQTSGDCDSDDPEIQMMGHIFGSGSASGQQKFHEVRQRMDAAGNLDKWEKSMLLGTGYKKQEAGDNDDPKTMMEKLEEQIHIAKMLDSDLQEVMKIARRLNTLSNMNNPSFQRFKPSVDGDEVQYRRMKTLGELPNIRSSSYAYLKCQPRLFKHKLLNREFQVRERGIMRDRQQLLYVLIDGSGSMQGQRTIMAAGCLMNRIKSVVKGDAKLWFSMFESYIGDEHKVHTEEEATEATLSLARGDMFTGGGTCIDNAVTECIKRIKTKMEEDPELIRPEILLVSDGDDTINMTFDEMQGIRLNTVVCCAGIQPELRKLVHATRGVYAHLD